MEDDRLGKLGQPGQHLVLGPPGSGNQGQFRSVYGYAEEVFYRPGTYTQVPIYRWKLVPTKGKLTGTVTANSDVNGANVSLLGSGLQDVVVHSDGRFEFDNVPSGDYQVTAGLNIGATGTPQSSTFTLMPARRPMFPLRCSRPLRSIVW